MQDIGYMLNYIMRKNNCSPTRAFLLLTEGDANGIRELQSESKEKTGRRLRNTGNIKNVK